MIDLGDTVTLTAANEDGDGNLVNPGSGLPTVSVTKPDGTTDTASVVSDGVGLWHADYVAVQAGRHIARWVATGTDAFTYTDTFVVSAADPGLLFSVEEARRSLRWFGAQATSADDEQLRDYIAAVTPVIEDIVGPIIPRTVDEWYDGGAQVIALSTTPIISVTSVTESWGANALRTLTLQPLDGVTPVNTYGYTINLASGILQRRISGIASPFVRGRSNVHVVYVAGQPLKANWRLAAREQLRFMWQDGQQGSHPGMGGDGSAATFTESGYAVPRRVVELCGAGDQRIPGIA